MSMYLGLISVRNNHVNFKPLYEYVDDDFKYLNQYDRQAILPNSDYGDINFYSKDSWIHVEDFFISDTYYLLDFDLKDLEDNIAGGFRNPTGYKIEASKVLDKKLHKLSELDRYYVLSEDGIEGSYRTNPILTVTDSYAYAGLEVVIPIGNDKKTVIGPFTVEWREADENLVIKTGLKTNKYILEGYKFPSNLDYYTTDIGRYDFVKPFIHLDKHVCKKVSIDVISKEQILTAFKNALSDDSFTDGKLDLENISDLVSSYSDSIFVGEEIPDNIRKARLEELGNLLTDEEQLNDTFGFISETISGLLDKYQDSEQYRALVQNLAENPDFMSRIQRYKIITEKIDKKQAELDQLTREKTEIEHLQENSDNQGYNTGIAIGSETQLQELTDKKSQLEADIAALQDELKLTQTGVSLQERLNYLNDQVDYKDRREKELDAKLDKIGHDLDAIFENRTEKAMKFAFDGMLANRMLQQAAEWEVQQNAVNYHSKINDLKHLTLSLSANDELIECLVERIRKYRPTYDRNTILNILICYTQGFLTVFSGEPGTGKTSICRILANALGLTAPEMLLSKYNDGYSPSRFVPISVERGWTTKRDFIGYYNPLTKSFDRSNRRVFDALNILTLEANGYNTDMPFLMLLDEANLSPMEYYWADFMSICDGIDCTSVINLGDDFCFNIPDNLRFVATINNDHTTESLSPRLVDRAWVIKLPRVKSGTSRPIVFDNDIDEVISWSALNSTFGICLDDLTLMNGVAKDIYEELLNKCRSYKISISARADAAIRGYWATAQRVFENDTNYGVDASIVALDYAVAQRILPHIDGSGEKYGSNLRELNKFCSDKNLRLSSEMLGEIIKNGDEAMQYYQFFA